MLKLRHACVAFAYMVANGGEVLQFGICEANIEVDNIELLS